MRHLITTAIVAGTFIVAAVDGHGNVAKVLERIPIFVAVALHALLAVSLLVVVVRAEIQHWRGKK